MTDDSLPVLRSRTVPAVAPQPALEADAQLSVELKKAHVLARGGDAIPKSYRGNDAAILLAMDWAAKRGLDLVTTLQTVSFVNGKPVIDATMQRALARQAGYRVVIESATTTESTASVFEGGELLGQASFTIAEAKAAGLLTKDSWKNYPSDMLVARATTRAVRRFAPDVMIGLAIDDEVELQRPLYVGAELQGPAAPVAAEIVDPVEVDNGDSRAGTAETGSTLDDAPLSQHEAVVRPKMRGEIRAMRLRLDDTAREHLKDWMKARGWVLDRLATDELADVMAYVTVLLGHEDDVPDEPTEDET